MSNNKAIKLFPQQLNTMFKEMIRLYKAHQQYSGRDTLDHLSSEGKLYYEKMQTARYLLAVALDVPVIWIAKHQDQTGTWYNITDTEDNLLYITKAN